MGEPLIQLVQDAQAELGLPVSSAVMGSSDNTARQFGALANRVGRLLIRMHDWTFLTEEWHVSMPPAISDTGTLTAGSEAISGLQPATLAALIPGQMIVSGHGLMTATRLSGVNVVAGTASVDQPASVSGPTALQFNRDEFPVPFDFERPINTTQWDRSMRWPLLGPMSPQSDQWVRSGIVATGPRRQFRQIDNTFRIWPVPYSGAGSGPGVGGGQLVSEYITNTWVLPANQVWTTRFRADQDVCSFDDDLMVSGLKYLFFRTKGFDYTMLETDFQRVARQAIAMDGPSEILDMSRRRFPVLISPANVPDSSIYGADPSGSFNVG